MSQDTPKPFVLILAQGDGWHETVKRTLEPTRKDPNPQGEEKGEQHYFYKGKSLCGKYKSIPKDAFQNNSEQLHCKECQVGIRAMKNRELE